MAYSPPLMPDEDNNFGGSLVLDFKNGDGTCNLRIVGEFSNMSRSINCQIQSIIYTFFVPL